MSKTDWQSDLQDSTRWFKKIVWPEVRHWFGDDPELHVVEDKDNLLAQAFDTVAGVDFWTVESGVGMISIASRVQKYDETTFTIRYSRASGVDTEYQKRMRQLRSHHELPTYTLQAYVDPTLEVLRNAAAVPTAELYEYVSKGTPGDDWPLIGSDEMETFFPVSWGELDGETALHVFDRERAELSHRPDDPSDITAWGDGDG